MINKKSLEIKNKKILIKEEDDYLDSVKSMTSGIVGDIANFTKDSAKIVGNLSKLLAKSGWYTFRAKILGNMTDEEFKRSLKDARVDFVTNSDANIRNIDSNVLKMLSSVGVSESEINGYLLGLPGYNVLENINVSSFLTGRKYKKDKFNKLNPFEFTAEEIILFFMINNLNSATGGSISQPNNSQVKKVLTDNVSKKQSIITQLKKTLNNKISNDFLEIINKEVIKKKNKDYFNLVKKSLKGTTFLSYKISKEDDATRFFAHIKSTFSIVVKKSTKKKTTPDAEADSSSQEPTSEMFDKLSLRINNNNLTLITEKDEFELDEYRKTVCELLDTIAASTVLINTDISKIILGEQLEEIQEELETAKEEVENNSENGNEEVFQQMTEINFIYYQRTSMLFIDIISYTHKINFLKKEIKNSIEVIDKNDINDMENFVSSSKNRFDEFASDDPFNGKISQYHKKFIDNNYEGKYLNIISGYANDAYNAIVEELKNIDLMHEKSEDGINTYLEHIINNFYNDEGNYTNYTNYKNLSENKKNEIKEKLENFDNVFIFYAYFLYIVGLITNIKKNEIKENDLLSNIETYTTKVMNNKSYPKELIELSSKLDEEYQIFKNIIDEDMNIEVTSEIDKISNEIFKSILDILRIS